MHFTISLSYVCFTSFFGLHIPVLSKYIWLEIKYFIYFPTNSSYRTAQKSWQKSHWVHANHHCIYMKKCDCFLKSLWSGIASLEAEILMVKYMESEPSKIKQVSTCLKHRGNIIACAVQLQFLCCTCICAFKAFGRCFYLTLRSIYLRKINITTSSTDSCFDKIMPQTEKDQFLVLLRLPQIF